MENYNISIMNGLHKIRVTLQQWKYKGVIEYSIGGNCRGKSLLDFDFECEECDVLTSDCNLEWDEVSGIFTATLKDAEGNECEIAEDAEEMNKMIVAIEIVDYTARES